MLPRAHRLTRGLFDRVSRTGRPAHTEHFSVKKLAAAGGRFGFSVVVSKKVAPRAVARNRLRRRAYEAIARLSSRRAWAAILYAKRGAAELDFLKLEGEIARALA